MLERLKGDGKEIIKEGLLEEKSFVYYGWVLLAVVKG